MSRRSRDLFQQLLPPNSGLMGLHPTGARSRPFPNCGSNMDWEINQYSYRNLEKVVILPPLDSPNGEGVFVGLTKRQRASSGLRHSLIRSIKHRYGRFRRLRRLRRFRRLRRIRWRYYQEPQAQPRKPTGECCAEQCTEGDLRRRHEYTSGHTPVE